MKQKIVLKVALDCDKCRSKALKIAAVAKGVSSVSIGGGDKDQVVVIGDGVDSVSLAKVLRKKFRHVSIVPRSCNGAAHYLACFANVTSTNYWWEDSIPLFLD
ncbi:heavy metal-associated isoprenylated plant protein 47-like [Senna tora]|uniref:Heavy metal-associated isoprenylated plant protein 47-like n=1 Tax=Senna tora TaxID=362788 RepID=A0A834U2J9_9FABA|nr:heavy metal-associated isoprenylated plant protein 47-like [Senna tora]